MVFGRDICMRVMWCIPPSTEARSAFIVACISQGKFLDFMTLAAVHWFYILVWLFRTGGAESFRPAFTSLYNCALVVHCVHYLD